MATARTVRWLALVSLIAILAVVLWLFGRARFAESPDFRSDPRVASSRAKTEIAETPDEREQRRIEAASASDIEKANSATDAPPETRVYGTVLDRSGRTIQGTWFGNVLFVDAAGKRQHVVTKDTGTYEFRGLGFGVYLVMAQADGYQTVREQFELRPEAPVVQKDFVLPDGNEVRVRVLTPEGGSLWDVMDRAHAPITARFLVPVATREPPGKRFEGIEGSSNDKFGVGSFQNYGPRAKLLGRDYFGILRMDCERPLYVSLVHFQSVLRTERVEPGQQEITFTVSLEELISNLAEVRLRVVDADNDQPIRGARAGFRDGARGQSPVSTDVQGSAEFKALAPGSYDLMLSAYGFEKLIQHFDAPPASRIDLGTIALDRELRLTGRALDGDGQPHEVSFSIGTCIPDEHRIDWFRDEGASCEPDGSFQVQGLGRRQYALRTRNYVASNEPDEPETWVSRMVMIDLREGPIRELEVRLEPPSNLFLLHPTAAAEGLKFRVVDSRGFQIVGGAFWDILPPRLMLPRDAYRVSVFNPTGGPVAERSVELRDAPVRLDLDR